MYVYLLLEYDKDSKDTRVINVYFDKKGAEQAANRNDRRHCNAAPTAVKKGRSKCKITTDKSYHVIKKKIKGKIVVNIKDIIIDKIADKAN